ncbi:MAG TPA: nitroreductase family protein [Anaerolineales bacterium]|nr:nitroreductase family protein [Anaerolineales bacterium]
MSHKQSSLSSTVAGKNQISPEDLADLGGGTFATLSDSKVFSRLWNMKKRLQFIGWLQYMPFGLAAILFFMLAGAAQLLGGRNVALFFTAVGAAPLVVFFSDLLTVKFRLRPRERLPKRRDDLDIFDLMRVRHSCRAFQTQPLTPNDLNELMESVRIHKSAPQTGKTPIRLEYIAAPMNVWPVVNATEFLVAITPKAYERVAIMDVGRTLQKVVIDATRMGLGTCWIGPGADHVSIQQHLGDRFDPEDEHIICVCAVGYPSRHIPMFVRMFNRQFRQRHPLSALFYTDADFTQPLDVDTLPFKRFGRIYEVCQWAPSSYNGQTTRCVAVTGKKDRSLRFDFYSATASRYYAPVAVGIWCANWEMGCDDLSIDGHFEKLPADKRGAQEQIDGDSPPYYDISWVLEDAHGGVRG